MAPCHRLTFVSAAAAVAISALGLLALAEGGKTDPGPTGLPLGDPGTGTPGTNQSLPGNKVVEPGVDYYVGRNKIVQPLSLRACSDLCQHELGCVAWVHYEKELQCWIAYSVSGKSVRDSNAVSGKPTVVYYPSEKPDCTSVVEWGVDYITDDYKTITTKTLDECTAACSADASCVAYTWYAADKLCWVEKHLTGRQELRADSVSGKPGPCKYGPPKLAACMAGMFSAYDKFCAVITAAAKQAKSKLLLQLGQELLKRKAVILATIRGSLKAGRLLNKSELKKAVVGAVASVVPNALKKAVTWGSKLLGFPSLVWQIMNSDPFVQQCY